MQKSNLRKFIIYSVVFHVVLISAILFYFYKHPLTGGKSGTVMVGVVDSDDITQGKSAKSTKVVKSQSESPQKNKPKIVLEESQKKTNQKITENKKQIGASSTQKKEKKLSGKPIESLASNVNPNNLSDGDTESVPNKADGDPAKGQAKALGVEGTSMEPAYPDYRINPKPKYPRTARKRGYEGEVKLKVFVLENGKVGKIEIIRPSGYEILDESALEAVRKWLFVPGRENGREISSWVTVPITFQLKSG